jgi:pyruvate formate lyase activating enzyme
MRCFWCHNPETICFHPELQVFRARCIGCGACLDACAAQALTLAKEGPCFDRGRCRGCGACAQRCFSQARMMAGRNIGAAEVVAECMRDAPFFARSGGGVTLSGGEPLCQPEFAAAVLSGCKDAGIATAIETNLSLPWAIIEPLIAAIDLFLVDIKHAQDDAHLAGTGLPLAPVIENFRMLAEIGKPVIVRTPVIPGYNDQPEVIREIASTIASCAAVQYYELLPFHGLGSAKYEGLGRAYAAAHLQSPPAQTMARLAEAATKAGVAVRCGR